MSAIFRHQLVRLLRDRILLMWTLGFTILMSLIFMAMFSDFDEYTAVDPVAIGVLEDDAYLGAYGLAETIDALSKVDAEPRLMERVPSSSLAEADAAARAGETLGYITVEDGNPVLHVAPAATDNSTVAVLRAVLDGYVQTRAEFDTFSGLGMSSEQFAMIVVSRDYSTDVQVTTEPPEATVRYYFTLLAFATGNATGVSMLAVQQVMATSSALGARRSLGGISRWRVLLATLGGSWLYVLASLLIAFHFMRQVAEVNFGPHLGLCHLAIAAASFTACAAGAVLGTIKGIRLGAIVAGTCVLSLFTGLYGPGSEYLATMIAYSLPWAAWINPLWQISRCFFALLYYDSLEPFWHSCAALVSMSAVFLTISIIRLRRMNHEHL